MNNKVFIKLVVSLLIIFTLLIIIYAFMPNFERISIVDILPDLKKGKIAFAMDGHVGITNASPVIKNENILLSTELIKKYIDTEIFFDGKYTIIVKDNKYIKLQEGTKSYIENNDEKFLSTEPIIKNGEMYIPIEDFKEIYDIELNLIEDRNILLIDSNKVEKSKIKMIRDSVIRNEKSYKSKIVDDVEKSEELIAYENDNKWTYVVKKNGSMGYISNANYVVVHEYKPSKTVDEENKKKEIQKELYSKKVNLLWYQISSKDKNPKVDKLKTIDSLTVMSPTWFEMIKSDGTIREKISTDIVEWAHSNGYKVWALIVNPFSDKELTHKILSDTNAREKVIKDVVKIAKENNIDGINVDIESISSESGEYYIQFMKELSVFTHMNDLILSVDMYMPSEYTRFYNRPKLGEIVDFFCLMAYDEHWRTSPESGSVASLPWVEEGIRKTLEDVPNYKILLGIPSYTRKWEHKDNAITSAVALGMEDARKDLESNNARISYLDEVGQNYGEYKRNGFQYKIWLEDETSLRNRLELMKKYDLAGTATWKQGFEKESVWSIYKEYLNE